MNKYKITTLGKITIVLCGIAAITLVMSVYTFAIGISSFVSGIDKSAPGSLAGDSSPAAENTGQINIQAQISPQPSVTPYVSDVVIEYIGEPTTTPEQTDDLSEEALETPDSAGDNEGSAPAEPEGNSDAVQEEGRTGAEGAEGAGGAGGAGVGDTQNTSDLRLPDECGIVFDAGSDKLSNAYIEKINDFISIPSSYEGLTVTLESGRSDLSGARFNEIMTVLLANGVDRTGIYSFESSAVGENVVKLYFKVQETSGK